MATPEDLLAIARAEVGNQSGAKYWNWYRDTLRPDIGPYINGMLTPYCAGFVSYVLAHAHVSCPCFPDLCTFDERCDFEGRHVDKYDLRPGDVVTFDWDWDGRGDHTGFCTGRYDWGIATIEGNTSGGVVAEKQQVWDNIICGVRPRYDESEVTDADVERIRRMVREEVGRAMWGYRNADIESEDAYQILRDIRTAFDIKDGQKPHAIADTHSIAYGDAAIARIESLVQRS